MKKIIISVFTIFAMTAVVAGSTAALFSDTETVTGNTISAGTLDSQVNGEDDPSIAINLSDLAPGDGVGGAEHSTITYQYTLSNVGSIDGTPWIEITGLEDFDNDCNDPESDVDTTCGDPGLGEGELSDNLFMQVNAAGAGGFEYPHGVDCIDGGRNCPLSTWVSLGPIGQGTWETIPGGGSTAPMVLELSVPTSVGNIIQSDSVSFDIVFHLDQV